MIDFEKNLNYFPNLRRMYTCYNPKYFSVYVCVCVLVYEARGTEIQYFCKGADR